MIKYDTTYWSNKGRYQELASALQTMIPSSGEVLGHKGNPKLERFRKASNCYYDLYNNGLCNRAAEFRQVFGIASSKHRHPTRRGWFTEELYRSVEGQMDKIILEAAAEQLGRLSNYLMSL